MHIRFDYRILVLCILFSSVLFGQDDSVKDTLDNDSLQNRSVSEMMDKEIRAALSDDQPDLPWKPSPGKAALLSLACPGAGQFYNKRIVKGCFVIGLEAFILQTAISKSNKLDNLYDKKDLYVVDSPEYLAAKKKYDDMKSDRNLYIWILVGVHLLNIADSYVDAHLYTFDSVLENDPISLLSEDNGIALKVNFKF